MKLVITPDGVAAAVYDDRQQGLYARLGGTPEVRRAGQVEWENGRWTARAADTGELWAEGTFREDVLAKERQAVESQLPRYAR
jgi:hypothetical protein